MVPSDSLVPATTVIEHCDEISGGAADKIKLLKVGDEILSVNNTDCTRMSRIEAWNFMKKLSDGTASIIVRQKLANKETGEKTNNGLNNGITAAGNGQDNNHKDDDEQVKEKSASGINGKSALNSPPPPTMTTGEVQESKHI